MIRSCALVMLFGLAPGCSWINVRPLPSGYAPPAEPECTQESNAPGFDIGLAVVGALAVAGSALYPSSGQSASSSTSGVVGGVVLTGVGAASAWYGITAINACKIAKDEALARAKEAEERVQRAAAQKAAALEAERAAAAEAKRSEALARAKAEADATERARQEALAREQAEAAAQTERAVPGWLSSEGYQGAAWGMSRAQVRKVFRKANGDDAILSFGGTTAGLPATTSLYFVEDRLVAVNVRFQPVGKTRSEREAFEALRTTLTEKYGEPSEPADSRAATWSTEKTAIELQLNPLSVSSRLVLIYSSRELEFMKAKLKDKAIDEL